MAMLAHVDCEDVLAARDGCLVAGDRNGFNRHIILSMKSIPSDCADDIQNYESKYDQSDQAAQHNANPFEDFAYHVEPIRLSIPKCRPPILRITSPPHSLANGISQEKGQDFPIIWEVFLGDGHGNLNRVEDCNRE
jgi:hypothetical protein